MCFIFLSDKKETTYNKMFDMVLKEFNASQQLRFRKGSKFYHDFEKAALNSITRLIPKTKIEGCYFYLVQSLWRQMQFKGLSNRYAFLSIKLNA